MHRALLGGICLLVAACSQPHSPSYADLIVRYTTEKPFSDVVDDLEFAIQERNFRITGHNKIGSVIRER